MLNLLKVLINTNQLFKTCVAKLRKLPNAVFHLFLPYKTSPFVDPDLRCSTDLDKHDFRTLSPFKGIKRVLG